MGHEIPFLAQLSWDLPGKSRNKQSLGERFKKKKTSMITIHAWTSIVVLQATKTSMRFIALQRLHIAWLTNYVQPVPCRTRTYLCATWGEIRYCMNLHWAWFYQHICSLVSGPQNFDCRQDIIYTYIYIYKYMHLSLHQLGSMHQQLYMIQVRW